MKICTALLGHPVQNNSFALIKKIFLQALVEIIFRYQKKYEFLDPLGPPYQQMKTFTYEVLGIKIG